ncbi:ras family-domain-containing protein [Protomyces lactucae-debilis]|uniref:Ras family-domain-containing protein n=1 Tax=Protomyces lactucae-debilis TaxID=2754530 RepID=A0A1Y2F467_PROLT|nr:ras family-domain-containing protein [Protomyces lactucae-debilis]ORY78669.1 ras family-domain-containing protein [Protomyces lactucae-debilis]
MSSSSRMQLYKLVVLGEPSIGKTALTLQMCLNHFVETYDPTIEDSYRKQVLVDEKQCILEILDTAGQEEYAFIRDQWIRDGEGFMLVYSVCSKASFDRILPLVDMMSRIKEQAPMPLVLIGNKSDRDADREVSVADGKRLANGLRCPFLETSAKKCINVEEAFFELARQIQYSRGEVTTRSRIHGPPEPSVTVYAKQGSKQGSASASSEQTDTRQNSQVSNGRTRASIATGVSSKSGFSSFQSKGDSTSSDGKQKKSKKDCIVM